MSKIAAYADELTVELDAFERDLAKLSHRMGEIGNETIFEADSWKFKQRVAVAKQHVDSAWRSMKYAEQSVNDN